MSYRIKQLRSRLVTAWHRLRTSLWLVPGLIVFGATALGVSLVELDVRFGEQLVQRWPGLLGAGVDGARAMLTVIAGSMVTVAGVVFSITLVVLSSAAAQYSPRVLRNFMADRLNQSVLGTFVGVYAYCLVVLRTIHAGDGDAFVPALAVLGGVVLAFVGVGYLIYFIHHVGVSIQASAIIQRIAAETLRSLRAESNNMALALDAIERDDKTAAEVRSLQSVTMCARETGYVVRVDVPSLVQHACAHDLFVAVEQELGLFVIEGQPLVTVAAAEPPPAALQRKVAAAIEIHRERTAESDPVYGLRQLGDVALRALSPGINDPTTARMAIDQLTAIFVELERLGPRRRAFGSEVATAGRPRLQLRLAPYESLLRESFGEIRQASSGNVAVLRALTVSLDRLSGEVRETKRRGALLAEALALRQQIDASSIDADSDRRELRASATRLVAALDSTPQPWPGKPV